MSTCQTVAANTDVLGKGIRINFYSTMLLIALIPQTRSTRGLLNALYVTAGISGFGLLLTAIIATAQHQLSLFHAIFILHILFFLGTGASPMGKYHWTQRRMIMGVFLQFASVIAFTGWALYVFVHIKNYGSQPECNDHIKYVIMFVTVRATVPWLRDFWIAVLVISAVGLIFSFVVQGARSVRTETQVGKPWYLKISIPLLLSAIYATINLELIVHRNEAKLLQDGTNVGRGVVQVDDSWQFGQVLAVVMIVANINEIVHFLFALRARRHFTHTVTRGAQAQGEGAAHRAEGPSVPVEDPPKGPTGTSASARAESPDKVASGYELQNLESRNSAGLVV